MAVKTTRWIALATLVGSALQPVEANAQVQPDSLLPTVALHRFHEELATADRSAQGDIAERALKVTQRGNLDDGERFALGELFFVALQPDPADSLFSLYLDGTDLRARMATQRKLRITMAAFTVYRGMEDSIRAARARFPVIPADPWHMRRVREALIAAGNRSARGERPPVASHVSGVLHRLEEGLLTDLDDAQRQRFLRGRLIGMLSGYLAQAGG